MVVRVFVSCIPRASHALNLSPPVTPPPPHCIVIKVAQLSALHHFFPWPVGHEQSWGWKQPKSLGQLTHTTADPISGIWSSEDQEWQNSWIYSHLIDRFKKIVLIIEFRDTQRPALWLDGFAFPQYFKTLVITAHLPIYLVTFFHCFYT